MSWDILGTLALFLAAISILPLAFIVFRTHARSKRGVIEQMAQLDIETRRQLDWRATEYVGTFDVHAPFRLGWQAWGLLTQRQNLALQRVLVHGLPNLPATSDETKKSARSYRRCSIFLYALFAVLVFLPALIGLSEDLAELTGSSTGLWRIILVLFLGTWVFLPFEKFKKWPEIGDAK